MLPRRLTALITGCCLAWSVVGTATPAQAQGVPVDQANDEQKAAARKEFLEARKAFDERRFADALRGLRASFDIVASPNTHLMIAHALRELGRNAEAYQELALSAEEAAAAAASESKYETSVKLARDQMSELRPKIGMLEVQIPGASEGSTLRVAGAIIDPSRWGEPLPVEPGRVTVTLSGEAGDQVQDVTVEAGGSASITIEPPTSSDAPPTPPPPPPPAEGDGETQRIFAYVAAGIGVAGFATAGVFGGMALSQFDELEDACGGSPCPDRQDDIDAGITYRTVSNVMLVVGGVGVSAGAALFFTSFLADGEETAQSPKLFIGPGSLGLKGTF